MKNKMRAREVLLLTGLITTVVSCGGGGGGGGGSAPVASNTINQPSTTNYGTSGTTTGTGSGSSSSTSNTKIDKYTPSTSVPTNALASTVKGEGVKVGILDVDFLSDDKKTDEFTKKENKGKKEEEKIEKTFKVIKTEQFGSRLKALENNKNSYDKAAGNTLANDDSHGLIVASVLAGATGGGATKSELYAMTIKDGNGFSINIEQYEEMLKSGVKIFNQSFGSVGKTVSQYGATEKDSNYYRDNYKAYMYYGQNGETTETINAFTNKLMKFYDDAVKDGALFVWAAGNKNGENTLNEVTLEAGLPRFRPSLHKGWLAVVGVRDEKTDFNPHLAWAGSAYLWTMAADGTCSPIDCSGRGSSLAAPRVAATAAKVKERFPWMSGHEIQQTLLTTATDMGDLGPDTKYGWGFLNIEKALKGPAQFDNRLILGQSAVNAGSRNGQFNANITDNGRYIFENDISGDAGLKKLGQGTLILTGTNTYKGNTNVEAGKLEIYKLNMSDIVVKSQGELVLHPTAQVGKVQKEGVNTLYSVEEYAEKGVYNEGTVKIEGKGALITGDYIATSGSKTEGKIGESLKVLGTTKLDVKSIAVVNSATKPTYVTNDVRAVPLIESAGEIEGNFGKVEGPELLALSTKVEDNNVVLEMSRKNTEEYVSGISSSDEMRKDTAKNVETLFETMDKKVNENGDIVSVLADVVSLQSEATSENIGDTLDSLAGQIHGSAQALTFKQSEIVNNDLTNRLSLLALDQGKDENYGLWTSVLGSNGKLSQKGYATGKFKLYGGQIGLDKKFGENLILGTSFSYSDGNMKFNRFGGEAKSENLGVSLYGRYGKEKSPYYVQGRVGLGHVTSKVEREIVLPNSVQSLDVTHKDKVYSGYLETGYNYNKKDFVFTPFVAISYDEVKRGAFKEDNSTFGLNSNKEKYRQTSGLLGLKLNKGFNINKAKLDLYGYGTYKRALNDEDLSFDASYNGLEDSKIKVKGIGLPKNSYMFGFGVGTKLKNNFVIYGNYDNKIDSKKGHSNSISTGFRWTF